MTHADNQLVCSHPSLRREGATTKNNSLGKSQLGVVTGGLRREACDDQEKLAWQVSISTGCRQRHVACRGLELPPTSTPTGSSTRMPKMSPRASCGTTHSRERACRRFVGAS